MMQPAIPTDNLYKFLALTGIAVLGFCFVVPNQMEDTMRPERMRLAQQLDKMADAFETLGWTDEVIIRDKQGNIVHMNFEPIKGDMDVATSDEKGRKAYLELLQKMKVYVSELAKVPGAADRDIILKKDDFKTYIKYVRGFDDKAYAEWAKVVAMTEIQQHVMPRAERAKQLKAMVREHTHDIHTIWYLAGKARTYAWLSLVGMPVGFLFAVTGFLLWYRRVQRHQDKLLIAEIADLTKAEKTTDAPAPPETAQTPIKTTAGTQP